jgi:hypothetical protein
MSQFSHWTTERVVIAVLLVMVIALSGVVVVLYMRPTQQQSTSLPTPTPSKPKIVLVHGNFTCNSCSQSTFAYRITFNDSFWVRTSTPISASYQAGTNPNYYSVSSPYSVALFNERRYSVQFNMTNPSHYHGLVYDWLFCGYYFYLNSTTADYLYNFAC